MTQANSITVAAAALLLVDVSVRRSLWTQGVRDRQGHAAKRIHPNDNH
jgi:hypothetical protein